MRAGLAPSIVQDVLDAVRRIKEEEGRTVLMVEQSVDLAISVGTGGVALAADYTSVAVEVGSFLQQLDGIVVSAAKEPGDPRSTGSYSTCGQRAASSRWS